RKYLLSWRFSPPFLAFLLSWASIDYLQMSWAVLALIFLFTVTVFWYAYFEFPWEKKWLDSVQRLVDECDFERARRSIEKPPLLLGYAAKIRRLNVQHRLEDGCGNTVEAYHALQRSSLKTLLPGERVSLD